MGKLFDAIGSWGRGKRDQAAAALKDDVRDGRHAIEDSEGQIAGLIKATATVRADIKRMEKDRDGALADAKKYTGLARRAAAAGDEDDVRAALAKAGEFKEDADRLKGEIDTQRAYDSKVSAQIDQLRTKVSKAKRSMGTLEARKKSAAVRKKLAEASAGVGNSKGLAALDNLEKAVNEDESHADALEELAGVGVADDSLEAKYGAGSGPDDDDVAAFMAKHG